MFRVMRFINYRVHFHRGLLLAAICFALIKTNVAHAIGSNQENQSIEFVNSSVIKSVKLHRLGWELSEQAIELNGKGKLLFSFDDISGNPSTYSYTVTHCDWDWNFSSIFLSDYMDGFEVNEIKDFSYSSGTTMDYTHFQLELPNGDVRLKISGNYLLRVFDTYKPDVILIQRCFVVYEPLTKISVQVRQPSAGEHRYSGQQLDLKVNMEGVRIYDPYTELKTVVCQNYLFQGCLQNVKPIHVQDGEIDYSHPDAIIFEGINEFRLFDTRSIRQPGVGILSVDYQSGAYHVLLKPEESKLNQKYSYYADLNGNFVVGLERSDKSWNEADYLWTYFTLKTPLGGETGKSVYLFGELTGWQLSPDNRMEYSYQRQAYEISLLLKQGAYSYRFVVADNTTGAVDATYFEGSHFDTENSYMVLVYYRPMGSRYDRIIGYQTVSSQR